MNTFLFLFSLSFSRLRIFKTLMAPNRPIGKDMHRKNMIFLWLKKEPMSQQKGTFRWFARTKLIFCACACVCLRFWGKWFFKGHQIYYALLESQHFSFFIAGSDIWWPFLFALRVNVAIFFADVFK